MIAAGADMIDVGGESTRPGAPAVAAKDEIRRVVPVIQTLAAETSTPISIDTQKAAVADAAIQAGARIINDVSGFQRDPEMKHVARDTGAGCILMHMRGTPATMQQFTDYNDLVSDICDYFHALVDNAVAAGIARETIMLDPGIGFSKTAEQNLELIARLQRFRELGRPLLVGPSRKSFIGRILDLPNPAARAWGTAAAVAVSVYNGADVIRVHDVAEMRQAALVAAALRNGLPVTPQSWRE
jgi:dihydropteroate synthase